jgi:hypothetical protein
VRQWAEALSSHPRWRELRLGSRLEGDPAAGGSVELGLQALLDDLRSRSPNPALELEDALDRRSPGLGAELRWALAGPASRVKAAVRAALALHGPRAANRLSADPQAVLEELLAAIAQQEAQGRLEAQGRQQRAERQQAWWRQHDGRRPGAAHDQAREGARDAGSARSSQGGSSRAWGAGSGRSRSSASGAQPRAPGQGRAQAPNRPARLLQTGNGSKPSASWSSPGGPRWPP